MSKNAVIVIRVERRVKEMIKEGAQREKKSITDFIISSTIGEGIASPRNLSSMPSFRGVPSWFAGLCAEARQGGASNYSSVGYEFGRHMAQMLEGSSKEVGNKVEELSELLNVKLTERDPKEVIKWLRKEFPRIISLIPTKRRESFLKGFYGRHDECDVCML